MQMDTSDYHSMKRIELRMSGKPDVNTSSIPALRRPPGSFCLDLSNTEIIDVYPSIRLFMWVLGIQT